MRKTVANQVKNPRRSARSEEIPSLASGWQTFSYGKLGELTENIRTFALPFESQNYTFKMQYEYDSWNRIQSITYPDGEVVNYDYNLGGMLQRVEGEKNGNAYKYINEIQYNPFEQKEVVYYGNGAVTSYNYDVLLRLSHLYSKCADGVMQDITYNYDSVGNINFIKNHASALPNTLGGTYRSDYIYDNLYRLTSATGYWHGNNTLHYETSIEYEKNGRISRKILHADTWLDGNYATKNYDNEYYYANSSQSNTLSYINNNHEQSFEWDLKGNMIYHNGMPMKRYLCWDEQNRLLGVKDDMIQFSYYLYDANGDRAYKFTGEYAAQNQSGQWHYYYFVDRPTLYVSPYLVTNKKGYTKHYYAESERIASRIGGGGLHDLLHDYAGHHEMDSIHKESSASLFGKVIECLSLNVQPQKNALDYLYYWQEFVEEEKECYWYHPDHLGSSSWITFTDGKAVQHLHYLPWGEDFVNQKSNGFDGVRFTFSAKEKDVETGLSYFGSRYYSSDLSIWLSVDPMAAKYPSMSPYVYCANNPVRLVDPNGEEVGDFIFNGTIIGNDGIDDGLLYVVRNVDNPDCDVAVDFILNNSGKTQAFVENSIAYDNSILIESSVQNRQAMINIVSKDNGLGGTADANNREYGGIIKDGKVIPLEPGTIGKLVLGKKNYLTFPGEATFHSHASGDTDVPIIDNTVTTITNGKPYACWEQKPSQVDIDNAGTSTHYVFAMQEKIVYMYNSSGIQATMPMNRFVNPQKIKRR